TLLGKTSTFLSTTQTTSVDWSSLTRTRLQTFANSAIAPGYPIKPDTSLGDPRSWGGAIDMDLSNSPLVDRFGPDASDLELHPDAPRMHRQLAERGSIMNF